MVCFCAVERPHDHPLRPDGYKPLDAFWEKRGYQKHPELQCRYHWKDIDQADEDEKRLTYWLKTLKGV